MNKSIRKILEYIILCFVLAALLFLLLFYNGSKETQKIIIVIASAWYVLWGYYHHTKEKTVDLAIVIEYLLYGVLGGLLVVSLL
ncbi:hypothetical protein A2572_04645 [Candidatus Collierbacteria bacterium RIFOXYD1_FULL_40_9]|uniref:Uncharacterized protein n=1 Tax=Candidatus Collierbacteria bacterium RIFOXYD1_FULL_40_9 TaxID=1817731 RepID=A0A1F5FUN4_9BACT|nr:MAG: hypothetical protein A2572_04645 [Candidatus Collierbacteria bacterium RIFOXYD1_FULL_40_9]